MVPGSVVLWPSLMSKSWTHMVHCIMVKTQPRSRPNKSRRRRRNTSPNSLPNTRNSSCLCFQWMQCVGQKLVQQVNALLSSSHHDGSDPMELCVATSGFICHWLWYELPACASGVSMTPQPEHPVSTLTMEQGLHFTSDTRCITNPDEQTDRWTCSLGVCSYVLVTLEVVNLTRN